MTNPNPKLTMREVKIDAVPYDNRRCCDYFAYRSRELAYYFGKNYRGRIFDRGLIDSFVYGLLRKLGMLDCLDASICIRDRTKLSTEIIMMLARNLAVYLVLPQRYGGKSRNMLSTAMMLLTIRLLRYRSGHGLPFRSKYALTKKEFGHVIDFIDNSEYLWTLADYWVKRYHKRVRFGYCDKL